MSGFDYAQQERRIAALEANRGASLRFGIVTGVDPASAVGLGAIWKFPYMAGTNAPARP